MDIDFDAADLIQALQSFFAPMARKHRDISKKHSKYNVEVRVGRNDKEGRLKVKFMSEAQFMIEFEIIVSELLKDYQKYIDGMMVDITNALGEAKKRRRAEKPIILLS